MEKKIQKTQVLIRERKNNLAKWGKMQGMINYHTPFTPMRGDPVNTVLPIEQNTLLKQLCLIPGHGIRLRQTPGGTIIETVDQPSAIGGGGNTEVGVAIAQISSKNEDGTYSFKLDSGGTISSEKIFPVKNSMSLPGLYEEGDYVLVHLVTLNVVSAGGANSGGE